MPASNHADTTANLVTCFIRLFILEFKNTFFLRGYVMRASIAFGHQPISSRSEVILPRLRHWA
jgi:hypothetical protein